MATGDPGADRVLIDRRRLIGGAAMAAAAGVGTVAMSNGTAEAATGTSAINVKDAPFGARGDGIADDRAAIQAAFNAVPVNGGEVYFPPGDYLVSGPLAPKSQTIVVGCHTPRWQGGENPASACKIRMKSGFAGGDGLIRPTGTTKGVTIRNLALVGAGVGTGLHGLRMPDMAAVAGEQSWTLEDVEIAGFTGDGIYGRVHVFTILNCNIHDNRRWGINASGGNRWNDVHVANCFLFYNRSGNLYFGGSEFSSAVDFVNCRFERAGTNPANIFSPLNSAAPGIRLASASLVTFANCNTDGNCGNGIEIIHEADTPAYHPNHITLVNCRLARDGTGRNQTTLSNYAGLKVRGSTSAAADCANQIKLVNCLVTYGLADDAGGGSVLGPRYGVWYENTNHFQWIGGNVDPSPTVADNEYFVGAGNNYRPTIVDLERGFLTVPLDRPGEKLPVPDGAMYFDGSSNRLNVRSNGAWRSVVLS